MASGQRPTLLHHVHLPTAPDSGSFLEGPLRERSDADSDEAAPDAQLLERFVAERDGAAFAELARRYGPLVYHVCRRVLHHAEDVEDAFQATFLILVRKASAVRRGAALGGWLHQVALRVALRTRAARRDAEPYPDGGPAAPEAEDAALWRDLRRVLDEEVRQLPARYREAVVLYYLSGQTTEEAARQLGCARGTVLSRLAWARERLRKRLIQRGVALTAGALAVWLMQQAASAAVPAPLIGSTALAASGLAAGKGIAAGVVSARAASLMEGVLREMFLAKLKTTATVCVLAALVALGVGLWGGSAATGQPSADRREETTRPKAEPRTRIALINLAYVLKHDDECRAARELFKKQAAVYQEREKVSRAKIEEYTKELAVPVAIETKDKLEREIRVARRVLEDDQEEARRKLAKLSDEQTVALYKKVREAAARYAKAHDIELVLQYTDASEPDDLDSPANVQRKMQAVGCTPLYAAPGIDISKEIVAVLNARRGKEAPGEGR
jgi:RNA polymerase sigma factor (sigma-70 family)